MAIEDFKLQMKERGWCIFPDVISAPLIQRMIVELEECYVRCREIQVHAGLKFTEGTVHHLIGQSQSFMDCLAEYEKLDEYFTEYFQGKYILNSFGGNILRKGMSYANKIHRDIRSFSGELPLMLNTLVMLDDFTQDNGATWLMAEGHTWADKPSEKMFDDNKFQIVGKAGSVAMWNSNLWHRAGENKTDKSRRSVTPELSKPFFKQGFDYPRALGYHLGDSYSPYLKQVLGFNSRTPKNLQEWYRKPEERFYLGDQG